MPAELIDLLLNALGHALRIPLLVVSAIESPIHYRGFMEDRTSGNVDVRAARRVADEQPAFAIGSPDARVVSPIVVGVVELEEMQAVLTRPFSRT